MRIMLKKYNRMLVIADCVWHGYMPYINIVLLPTIYFGCGKFGWTIDIVWLHLFITFGCVKIIKCNGKI